MMKFRNFFEKFDYWLHFWLRGRQCRDCVYFHKMVGAGCGFCTYDENALITKGRWPCHRNRRPCCPRFVPLLEVWTMEDGRHGVREPAKDTDTD